MINYYEVIAYCNRYNISVEEFFLLYRIYSQQANSKKLHSFSVQSKLYQSINTNKINYIGLFNSLIDKNLIMKKDDKLPVRLSNLLVTDDYIKTIFIVKEIAFQEALDVFPDYMDVEGKLVNAKTCKVGGASYLEDLYFKTIGGDPKEHGKFLILVENKYKIREHADQKFETLLLNWKILRGQYAKEMNKKNRINEERTNRV